VGSLKYKFLKQIGRWMMERLVRIPEKDHYFTAWFTLSFAITTTISAIIVAAGNPIGASLLSHLINIGKIVTINGLLFLVWTIVVAALFSFIYLPLPRLFLASFSYTLFSTITILIFAKSGILFSFIIGIIYSIMALIIGHFFIMIFHKNTMRKAAVAILIATLISSSIYLLFDQIETNQNRIPASADYADSNIDENPANKGEYDYTFFTYGTGHDFHRKEFGKDADLITPTVDASDFITNWSKDREEFWGFGPSQLPVNGRVWVPEGEGTFPIILMVHGNHTMEYFSTGGYDYLGEQFASRGFIAISIDQDFINYSNKYGIPNDDYELRAWMFLQHLVHLQDMNETPHNYLYQKVDFHQVALVGHSRGGQAAHMAADYKTFFDDGQLLESIKDIDIKAVVAIAPTDKKVKNKKSNIHNTSYLLLHGARDADVSAFRDQQFYRTTFDPDYNGFKASLYIADANHTQFNTSWGSMDLSFPKGIFLNKKQTMDPEDQQQLTKVYLSAFFETVFHRHSSYEELFQDYQYGEDWLPETTLVSKYRHASYMPIIMFNHNDTEVIDVNGFTKSEITTPKDRRGNKRLLDALHLEWEDHASYTIHISGDDLSTSERIVFTMANIDDDGKTASVPKIEVELETTDGVSIRLPLDDYMPFPPVISTDYTHFGLLDDSFRNERYNKSWEAVFQTFEVPIATFEKSSTAFKKENINKITLHFRSQPGKILIEEIGSW
jgi:dienelactone hydrolase